eukprot:TRINITY_DN4075_c0_g1_i1.p1 TRINITY_DN4075_c0_g1~~TRINITY_DN4075_c0_g1_i1.p1  ORF type:complete len:260 (-),score=74.84 TRINITY_DN4075_c0_g1_i1:31-810(-)
MAHHEDDDDVVEEIPVFLAGSNESIQGDLYVVQFPLRERGRPYGDGDGMGNATSVQWKKKLKVLEIAFPLLESANYDPEALFKMDHLRLRSRGNPGMNTPTNYGVGVVVESFDPDSGVMHKSFVVRPVKGVMQMYPRFEHVDHLVQREAQLDMEIEEEEEMKRKANEVKTVISKAKRIGKGQSSEGPDRPSYARMQKEFARDPWINLEVKDTTDLKINWEATREELEGSIEFPLTTLEYMDYLAPNALEEVDSDDVTMH